MKYNNCSLRNLVEEEGLAGIVVKAKDSCAKGPGSIPQQGKVQKQTDKEKPARNEKEGCSVCLRGQQLCKISNKRSCYTRGAKLHLLLGRIGLSKQDCGPHFNLKTARWAANKTFLLLFAD